MPPILPVYYQIKQTIKDWIVNKDFNPGGKIPSENELVERFKVNRLTVRQAISHLIQEGFLVSKRGYGIFVTDDKDLLEGLSSEYSGFMDQIFSQIQKVETKFVEINKIIATKYLSDKLELDKREEIVTQIKRTRFLGNSAFNYIINYVPLEIGSKLTEQLLYKKPFLQILEQDFGLSFSEAFQTIKASFADQEVAEKLGILAGSPTLFVERILYGQKRKPIELVQISYRGDLFKYVVRLKNVKGKKGNVWVHQSE